MLAIGRDYTDVAPMDGVILGSGGQRIDVSVNVMPVATDASRFVGAALASAASAAPRRRATSATPAGIAVTMREPSRLVIGQPSFAGGVFPGQGL